MPSKPPLSSLEQEVMSAVWSLGTATAAEIQAALAPQRILKDSTVRTLLTRLEAKSYLQHIVDGRTFVYSSTDRPTTVAVRAVRQIVDRFCQGSVESLLVGMVDDEVLDAAELQEMVDRLTARKPQKESRTSKRKGNTK